MYDPKREPREFLADTREEAVAEAARYFGVEPGELRVKEVPEGGAANMAGRVLIVAALESAPRMGGFDDDGPPRGGRGRDDRGGRGGRDRGGRDRGGRERGDRGGRGGRGERGGRERGGRARGSSDRGEASDRQRESLAAEEPRGRPPEAVGESKGVAIGELGPIGQFVLGVIERMRVGPFEIQESAEGDLLALQLRGPAAERLGAGDGRAIDAIQLIANQAAMRSDENPPRVILDAEGQSEKREEFLSRLAERAARRASDTGRSVALDPMNSRDRRIIHVALRETDGVATMSVGTGRYRQVVVVPEGSPEYAEAVEASREADSR